MTNNQKTKEKEMKTAQTYPAALIAIHTIDSAPHKSESALRGLMQRLGLAFLVWTLVIGATGSASAGRNGEGLRSRGGASRQRQHSGRVLQLPDPLHQTRCRVR